MKRLYLAAAIGLGFTLSVGAQTTTTDEKQEPAQQQGKARVEQTTKAGQQKLAPHRAPAPNEQTNVQERSGTIPNRSENAIALQELSETRIVREAPSECETSRYG